MKPVGKRGLLARSCAGSVHSGQRGRGKEFVFWFLCSGPRAESKAGSDKIRYAENGLEPARLEEKRPVRGFSRISGKKWCELY